MDILSFVFPVGFVSNDVKQIFVRHDIIISDKFGGIADNIFWKSDFSRNFNRERTSRVSHLQHEERLHLRSVVKHGPVNDGRRVLCKMLKILVVCRDDAVCAAVYEFS